MYNHIIFHMEPENQKFMERWKKDEDKEHIRVTILKEAADFVSERAHPDFGLGQSSVSLEISKLIMIAKDCLEKKASKK